MAGIIDTIREPVIYFIGLYKMELLTLAAIIAIIYYIVTNDNRLTGVNKNELWRKTTTHRKTKARF